VIRKEAWPFYRTISVVRLCWELEEPKGPKGTILGYPNHISPLSPLILTDLTHPPTPSLSPCGVSMAGALILQPRDTMSLTKADLGSIERRGIVDTLVALLNFFFLISDTCLDLTLLTATYTSRHISMIHACIALHFVDVRTLGETPSQPHLSPFTFGV